MRERLSSRLKMDVAKDLLGNVIYSRGLVETMRRGHRKTINTTLSKKVLTRFEADLRQSVSRLDESYLAKALLAWFVMKQNVKHPEHANAFRMDIKNARKVIKNKKLV